MPAKNAGAYLNLCIQSIQAQSETNWELLVTDDFSSDDTSEIVTGFSKKDARIRLLKNKTPGIISALALAFQNSRGTFISRMDADDLMPPEKLATLLQIAMNNKKVVATGRVTYFSNRTISEGYQRYQYWLNDVAAQATFRQNIYRECVIASPNWMVHRTCFEKDILISELNYPEDYDLVLKWFGLGYEFVAADSVTHLWREHPERTSRNSDIYQQKSFFNLKTKFFVEHELKSTKNVQLIGKGQKGKLVARMLKEMSVSYEQFGYGDVNPSGSLKSVDQLKPDIPAILTNWPVEKEVQRQILDFLAEKKIFPGKNLWLF